MTPLPTNLVHDCFYQDSNFIDTNSPPGNSYTDSDGSENIVCDDLSYDNIAIYIHRHQISSKSHQVIVNTLAMITLMTLHKTSPGDSLRQSDCADITPAKDIAKDVRHVL